MVDYKEKLVMDNMATIQSLVRVIMRKLGISKSEYEDYLQEAYLMILNKASKYDPHKKFSNFAYSVIKNGFVDIYRKNPEHNIELSSLDCIVLEDNEGNGQDLIDILSSSNQTENEALQNVTVDLVKKYITQAKCNCGAPTTVKGFEALELKMAGYTGEQIADMFHVPSNSLRSWMSKARKILVGNGDVMALLNASRG